MDYGQVTLHQINLARKQLMTDVNLMFKQKWLKKREKGITEKNISLDRSRLVHLRDLIVLNLGPNSIPDSFAKT